jgi:hypothetical protein
MVVMTLEDEIMQKMAEQMSTEVDREILWGMLEGMGWTRVLLPKLIDNHHAIDITYWLEENCRNPFERNGRDFIFESQKDANWFMLRWMS